MAELVHDKPKHAFHVEDGSFPQKIHEDAPAAHHGMPNALTQQALASHLDEDEKRIKRIFRRLDLRLVLMLALLYVWAFIDRGNLGNVSNNDSILAALSNKDLGEYRRNEHRLKPQCRQPLFYRDDDSKNQNNTPDHI